MLPETKYAKSGDIHIAYQITGSSPVDVVLAPGTASHLDLDWDWPLRAHFYEDFASFCRLIRFDKRGTGLSDRPTHMATLEERTDDIRAVMDAAGNHFWRIGGGLHGLPLCGDVPGANAVVDRVGWASALGQDG